MTTSHRAASLPDREQGDAGAPAPSDIQGLVGVFTGASLDLVKIVAAIAMLAAHVNEILLHNAWRPLWDFGRLAFPLFSFAVACNLLRGVKRPAYLQMFLLLGALSQPIYAAAFAADEADTLFSLAAGAAIGIFLKSQKPAFQHAIFALGTAAVFTPWIPAQAGVDGGIAGMLFPAALFLALEGGRAHIVWLVILLVGLNSAHGLTPFDIALTSLGAGLLCLLVLLAAAAFRRRPRILPRYALQAFYPAHLLILTLARAFG
jgi:hypothetical protein